MPKRRKPKHGPQNASKGQTRKRVDSTLFHVIVAPYARCHVALRDLLGFYDRAQTGSAGWTTADAQRLVEIRELVK